MNGGRDVKIGDDKRPIPLIPNTEVPLYDLFSGEILTDESGFPLVTEVDQYFTDGATVDKSTPVVFTTESSKTQKKKRVSVASTTATISNLNTNNIGIVTTSSAYTLATGDLISGPSIPDATIISRVGIGSIYISNFTTNSTLPKTEKVLIQRESTFQVTSDPVLKVAEQFPDQSEVSTTLLGINREERQLGLFANVSSYGLDPNEFEYFTSGDGGDFGSWQNRKNKTYGNRYRIKVEEETQESAIKISIFPVPYSFPYGPKFASYGGYNSTLFPLYLQFIKTGNDLYNYYSVGIGTTLGYSADWKNNFLSPSIATITGSGANQDVSYVAGITTSFAQIDTWTDTWKKIVRNQLKDPVSGGFLGESYAAGISTGYTNSGSRGGYSEDQGTFVQLQSRRFFRYQPGRISGFTFGLRSSKENISGVELEWGIENPTDQYTFRIFQGNLFIVRRSTVPLEQSVLQRNGLNSSDQTFEASGNPYDTRQLYTVKIPQDNFNGDTLRGTGDSVYLLDPEKVTMYKIEFGWYGAIGARFYAYVPVENDEARWVVIHTLVIENQLGRPCLQDSYFRFKYSIKCTNTGDITTPHYIYKYGASYYIDGGDQGSFTNYSVSSGQKTLFSKVSGKSTSLFGILPKDYILNGIGSAIQNKKLIIPTELTIASDSLAKIDIVTCKGCPGFAHVYTPGVATTESGRYVDIEFYDENTIEAINDTYFYSSDVGAKLIAPSIYNAYITEVTSSVGTAGSFQRAVIKGVNGNNRNIPNATVLDRVTGIPTTISIGSNYPYPVRLSNYSSYVASDYKFTGSRLEIQFLSPGSGDDYGHTADYLIGVTNVPPVVVDGTNTLSGFTVGGAQTTVLPNSSILFLETKTSGVGVNENAVETGELGENPFGIDARLSQPPGAGSGSCARAVITVLQSQDVTGVTELNKHPVTNVSGSYIEKQGSFPNFDYDGGEITIKSGNIISSTSSKYVGIVSSYSKIVSGQPVTFSYIQISSTLGRVGLGAFSITLRPLQIGISKTKIFNYNPYPLYLVFKLRDNARINNITIKETTADKVKTTTPKLYIYSDTNTEITTDGNADATGIPATNYKEVTRLSAATVDTQNYQQLRPYTVKDTVYVNSNEVNNIDLKKTFGIDRNVITQDILNTEATFVIATKLDSGDSGIIESTINYKEQ